MAFGRIDVYHTTVANVEAKHAAHDIRTAYYWLRYGKCKLAMRSIRWANEDLGKMSAHLESAVERPRSLEKKLGGVARALRRAEDEVSKACVRLDSRPFGQRR